MLCGGHAIARFLPGCAGREKRDHVDTERPVRRLSSDEMGEMGRVEGSTQERSFHHEAGCYRSGSNRMVPERQRRYSIGST